MVSGARRNQMIVEYFQGQELEPSRVVTRHDGTYDLTWHVDDCGECYVRLTSSTRGPDCVLVARDRRRVDSAVLGDLREIYEWVRSRMEGMVKGKLNAVHGAYAAVDEGA